MAEYDFLARGEDNNGQWVTNYSKDSKTWLYDWLTSLGVSFDSVGQPPGNSVPRLHFVHGKGWGLVGPIYRAWLRHSNIRFLWATKADRLIVRGGAVRGVEILNLRTGKRSQVLAHDLIVATGGFQSKLEMVLENWPHDLPRPERILLGAAESATASGHRMVLAAGGTTSRLDHQWNYVGLPDPRDASHSRGLAAFNPRSIWVNSLGQRFTAEFGDEKLNLQALLRQPGGTY